MSSQSLNQIRTFRLEKAAALRAKGVNPYPAVSKRTNYAAEIVADFDRFSGKKVVVAGRLMAFRKQGALAFGKVQDQSGSIQLFIRRNVLDLAPPAAGAIAFADLNLLDIGDFVEGEGAAMKTDRGEISVSVESLRPLAKSLRPLPDQWSGLADRETILRKRYLDVIMNPASHERFATIAKMLSSIRRFLEDRGFIEIPTPILQPQYGGGTAKPFKTALNALGCDMYLAISHELYLKRLIAAGYDKVFTIGRYFRNEGIDRSHHPEFSMVETMTAYANYEYNMALVEDMFRHVATTVFGRTEFVVRGHTIDFAAPWKRISMAEAVREKTGVDFLACASTDEANGHLRTLGVEDPQASVGEAMVRAFEHTVEATLIQPTLVYGHPIEISPLAKPCADDPRLVERFEIFIAGMECGDNWSEQNDPVKILETWRKAYKAEDVESGKAHTMDYDFIEMLEYGLPPTTGIGPGIERMAMIFTGQENIDDVIFFPLLRPEISRFNAELYGVAVPEEKQKSSAEAPKE
jgi:lysyl-tRNA synthetase class 2